ncbi:tyrosine-type recombinase/integrase [Phocaeicola plebeius]
MATVKVKLHHSKVKNHPGSIVYFVTSHQMVRQLTTKYKLFPHEWDEKESVVILSSAIGTTENSVRKDMLRMIAGKIHNDVIRLNTIIGHLSQSGTLFTSEDVIRKFQEELQERSFQRFMEKVILQLKQLKKERTMETYRSALDSFMSFRHGEDVLLDEISSELMMGYEAWLKARGLTMNTVSFYNRILRAVYNRAVEQELTVQCYPFKRVYTGIDKTVKRAVSLEAIKSIKEMDLSARPSLDFARDMFLFSFYTRGMSFIDMAYLRQDNLKNGYLVYQRRKTGRRMLIKLEKYIQDLLDKYREDGQAYLLPIIRDERNSRRCYLNALRLVNVKLKAIAEIAGLPAHLTMYAARHSWATIAQKQHIPLSVISESMGHDSENTTRIYLAELDSGLIDEANSLILGKL